MGAKCILCTYGQNSENIPAINNKKLIHLQNSTILYM